MSHAMPPTGAKRPPLIATWPIVVIGIPAFVAVWSGWVGLAQMTGFGIIHPLPGIWDAAQLNTCITLAIGVEAYAAYALKVWVSSRALRTRRFAAYSAVGSLVLGMAGQAAYHLMVTFKMEEAPAWITLPVACLPVAVFGMGAVLHHFARADKIDELAAAEANAAANATAERERLRAERVQLAEIERETAEAELRRVAAEREIAELAEREANAELERERIRGEREAARRANAEANATPNARANARPNGKGSSKSSGSQGSGSDQAERGRRATEEDPDAFVAWAAKEGTDEPMSNRDLAALLGVTVDAARTQANRWRKANRSGSSGPQETAPDGANADSQV